MSVPFVCIEPISLGSTSVSERASSVVAASCVRLSGSEVADPAELVLFVRVLSEMVMYESEVS